MNHFSQYKAVERSLKSLETELQRKAADYYETYAKFKDLVSTSNSSWKLRKIVKFEVSGNNVVLTIRRSKIEFAPKGMAYLQNYDHRLKVPSRSIEQTDGGFEKVALMDLFEEAKGIVARLEKKEA